MATTGRTAEATHAPDEVATLAGDAGFVHLLGRADGDGLAAVGLLGRALDATGTPYQVSIARCRADAEERLVDGGTTLGIGLSTGDASLSEGSAALEAYETASRLDTDPDPFLAIAGAVAGGFAPSGAALAAAEADGVERRPGLGLPTAELATGLAYSGLVHASFSGDEQAVGAFLADLGLPAELDDDAHTRLASAVALDATGQPDGSRAVAAIDALLAPFDSPDPAPFETIEGYADVLDALAWTDPGTGVAYLLGHEDREAALDVWKAAGTTLHPTVERMDLSAEGDIVGGAIEDGDPRRVARLVRDFRAGASSVVITSADAVALATGDGEPDARARLAAEYDEDRVAGTETLALAAVEDDLESIRTTLAEATT
jgi:hypothetical protein